MPQVASEQQRDHSSGSHPRMPELSMVSSVTRLRHMGER